MNPDIVPDVLALDDSCPNCGEQLEEPDEEYGCGHGWCRWCCAAQHEEGS